MIPVVLLKLLAKMILAPNFPYTVHDEPTEDWTVEQLIHWYLLRSQAKTEETRDELLGSLQRQFEEGKTEILSLCEKAQKTMLEEEGESMTDDNALEKNDKENNTNTTNAISSGSMPLQSIDTNTNNNPITSNEEVEKDVVKAVKKKTTTTNNTAKSVTVLISAGPYEGQTFVLRPRPRHPCFVGRSAGKKFREKGISLPEDAEVSTTHGKFEMKVRKLYFTDMGSTNGTLHEGIDLEPNTPLEVHDGMELVIGGQTIFQLTLGYT